jgi:hypothetical protein
LKSANTVAGLKTTEDKCCACSGVDSAASFLSAAPQLLLLLPLKGSITSIAVSSRDSTKHDRS